MLESNEPKTENADAQLQSSDVESAMHSVQEATKAAPNPYDGPNDKRNPRNWSGAMKFLHVLVPCVLAFQITIATSSTVPATAVIAKEFNLSRTASLLTLTLYTLGLAIGPVIIAPFSEIWGRKPIYVATSTCLMIFIGGASASQNFATLLICRFLAGILGSAGVATGAGTISDCFDLVRDPAGSISSVLFILGPFLGPTLGPLAGAYILAAHGNDWRWTQYLLLFIGAPVWLACVLMKETSRKWILHKETGDQVTGSKIISVAARAIMKPSQMLFKEVVVLSMAIYTAFAYAMIFSYFASASYVLQTLYGFSLKEVGLSFISVIIGYILGTIIFLILDRVGRAMAAKKNPPGTPAPEARLWGALIGSVFLPGGLFWYAWEAHRGGRWAPLVAAGIFIGLGAFTIFLSVITYTVSFYGPAGAASAIAANGILRYVLGAIFPLFTIQMFQNLGVHWAASLFGFIALGLLPIPWLLYKYGPALRSRSIFVKQASK